jgi:hypothetical protein
LVQDSSAERSCTLIPAPIGRPRFIFPAIAILRRSLHVQQSNVRTYGLRTSWQLWARALTSGQPNYDLWTSPGYFNHLRSCFGRVSVENDLIRRCAKAITARRSTYRTGGDILSHPSIDFAQCCPKSVSKTMAVHLGATRGLGNAASRSGHRLYPQTY